MVVIGANYAQLQTAVTAIYRLSFFLVETPEDAAIPQA